LGDELLPETVFATAGRVGLGVEIDRSVVARVIEILGERAASGRPAEMFVNICADLFQDSEFPGWLRERISAQGISARDIIFEVSEDSLYLEGRKGERFIAAIRDVGCRVSIERFGRRDDALVLLSRSPVDYVKLDRSVTEGIEKDRGRLEDLMRLLTSVRKLGPEIIAGGVEAPATLGALYRCEIQLAQGYFLQEPFSEMAYDFSGDNH
jgi:EAL domain-containing protein (putative c-di-GMP-specific phosphodiesterase class I)